MMSRMESFLIVSKDKKNREEKALQLCQEININSIDINALELTGIENVRNLQKTLFFAPLKGKIKAVIIHNAHNLTLEAQNALLKILEEPPSHTIIVLTAENKELLLPTILSRCKIIELSTNYSRKYNTPSEILSEDILVYLQSTKIGGRLKLAQELAKNKEETIAWLENAILALRQQFMSDQSNYTLYAIRYTLFHKTYVILKTTNTNPRLTLENLFLNL